jgi:hypothetical protein
VKSTLSVSLYGFVAEIFIYAPMTSSSGILFGGNNRTNSNHKLTGGRRSINRLARYKT